MSLEDVKEDILQKAKADAEAIRKGAEAEKAKIIALAKAQAEEMRKEKEATQKKETELLRKKADAAGELEQKKAVLSERKRLIEEVFILAMQKLQKMPKAEMKKKLESLQKKAGEEIKIGTIYCNKRDKDFFPGKAKDGKMSGGLVAESQDGSVSVDYSFETLLADIKEKKTEEISGMLFG